jgi:hypothetical protein
VGERLAGGWDISPVRGDAGLRDPYPDLFFDPGPAEGGAGLVSQVLGLAPVAASHRQQGPLHSAPTSISWASVCSATLAASRKKASALPGSPARMHAIPW